jgi:hypothetical protein
MCLALKLNRQLTVQSIEFVHGLSSYWPIPREKRAYVVDISELPIKGLAEQESRTAGRGVWPKAKKTPPNWAQIRPSAAVKVGETHTHPLSHDKVTKRVKSKCKLLSDIK